MSKKSASPPTEEPVSKPSKKSKKKSKPTEDDQDTVMAETEPVASTKVAKAAPASLESFSDMYLRKITAELADDLDKVREAPDFKANSIPMLVHALRQGESLYSADEKRRIVSAAGH